MFAEEHHNRLLIKIVPQVKLIKTHIGTRDMLDIDTITKQAPTISNSLCFAILAPQNGSRQ